MALMLHRKAAEQGHPLSQFDLGNMYDLGLGVGEDRAEAFKWFRRSAAQGYGDAQVNLGAMYYRGEGTAQDYVEAYKWFSIAAAGGGYLDTRGNVAGKIDATRRRDILARQMTPAQIAEAQDRALQWKPIPERAP
jgi:TPR repeat protein